VNDKLQRMWKEAAVASFKALFWHLPGGIEENHKKLSQDSRYPGQHLNPIHPAYEAGVITTRPRRSVTKFVEGC
jgi:hypothetical protein